MIEITVFVKRKSVLDFFPKMTHHAFVFGHKNQSMTESNAGTDFSYLYISFYYLYIIVSSICLI